MSPLSNEEVRGRLDALIRERGEDYSAISRLLGRNAAYVQQFIRRGTPRRLAEHDRRRLADYFRVPEEQLGGLPRRALDGKAEPLQAAIGRLAGFRDGMADDALIDAASGLTADDLDLVLERLIRMRNVVSIRQIDMNNLPADLLRPARQ